MIPKETQEKRHTTLLRYVYIKHRFYIFCLVVVEFDFKFLSMHLHLIHTIICPQRQVRLNRKREDTIRKMRCSWPLFHFTKKKCSKICFKICWKVLKDKQTNRNAKISGLCCLCAQGRQEAEYIRNIAYVYEEVFSDLQRSALNAFLE